MPYLIRLDETDKGIVVNLCGQATGTDIIAANLEIKRSDKTHFSGYIIWDFTKVENLIIDRIDLHMIHAQNHMIALNNPNCHILIVCNPKELDGGSKTYQELWLRNNIPKFYALSTAKDWVMNSSEHSTKIG